MLLDLDAETLYDVIQNVGNYVVTGERCDCDTTLSRVVCEQLISVINRKAEKALNSISNLKPKAEAQEQEQEPISVSIDDVIEEKQEVKPIPTYAPEPKPVQTPIIESDFSNEEELANYLLTIQNKPQRDRQMNDLCRKYRLNIVEVLKYLGVKVYG